MEKVGIITIPDYNNYGNRLQNYAVKRVFEKRGFEVFTLELNDPHFAKYRERKYKLTLKKCKLLPFVFAYNSLSEGLEKARRDLCFEKFTLDYLNVRYEPNFNDKTKEDLEADFSYFVLGSDQIWHPFVNDTPYLFFAEFAPQDKRIYYAPSFGVDKLTADYSHIVFHGLSGATKISVREQSGKDIIKSLLNIDAEVLIDPTLMLDSSEWGKLASKPKSLKHSEYILQCFLGPLSEQYTTCIDNVAKRYDLPIYSLGKGGEGYISGPKEFIYSIKNAEFVLTDSFHTVVFAILFNRPFMVFSRLKDDGTSAGLDSRVDNLLKNVKLEQCKYITGNNEDIQNCDFSNLSAFLDAERTRSMEYLCSCIK